MPRKGLNRKRGLESLIPQFNENAAEKKAIAGENSSVTKSRKTSAGSMEKSAEMQTERTVNTENTEISENTNGKKITDQSGKAGKPAAKENHGNTVPAGKNSITASPENTFAQKENHDGIRMIRLSQVVPNRGQPRKSFDEDAIAELTESILQYGVLQPLLVQKKGRYYEIIAGERRWRASRAAGLKEIPCIVREFDKKETMEVSLIENIQREDLNPIEEAEAYHALTDGFNMTQEEIASRVGRSRASVANSLRLLKLTPEVRQMVMENRLSMGHARALLGIEDPTYQTAAAEQVEEKQLSVRETEQLVKRVLNPPKERRKTGQDEQVRLAYKDAESRMQKKLGTKVSIHSKGKKGKIEIEYYSEEDLDRILKMIG